MLQRQPLFYLMVADYFQVPLKSNPRTAQMDLREVLEYLQGPLAEETESALLQRLYEFLFPKVDQFSAEDKNVLGYEELLKVQNMQVLNQLDDCLKLDRALFLDYFKYSIEGSCVKISLLREKK